MSDKQKQYEEEIREHEPDLYESRETIEQLLNEKNDDKVTLKKHEEQRSSRSKFILGIIAIMMVLSVVGTIAEIFNISALKFLEKSEELSEMHDVKQYKQAVVTIKSESRKGTGFNIHQNGLIMTNYHIVKDNTVAKVSFPNGSVFAGKVLRTNEDMDFALIKLTSDESLPFLNITFDKTWGPGDHIYFVGNPLDFNQIANEGEILDEKGKYKLSIPVMRIIAPIYNGNSGSPVINETGKVIGMIYAKSSEEIEGETEKIGLAIPLYQLEKELKEFLVK